MAKIQVVMLVVVAAGILAFVYAVFAEDPNPSIGFTGLSAATLRSNMLPDLGAPTSLSCGRPPPCRCSRPCEPVQVARRMCLRCWLCSFRP